MPTLITLAALMFLGSIFTNVWTNRLWFQSVDYSSVYSTLILTRVGLFLAFGLIFGLFVGINIHIAHRFRPDATLLRRDDPAARYRFTLTPVLRPALIAVSLVLAGLAGAVAQSRWSIFQRWLHGTEFGETDPHFGRDIGFFVFDFPWLRFLGSFTFTMIVVAIVASVFVHYVFGGIRLQSKGGPKFSRAAQVQVAVLMGFAVLAHAFGHWLDRYGYAVGTSGLFDGIGYTDANARIPSKNILIVVAIICAILFFSTVFFRSWTLPAIGLGLLFLTTVLIGWAWPAVMQQFQVSPSEPDREGPFLERNIESTRAAYGVDGVETVDYTAVTELTPEELNASASERVSARVIDPTLVSPAFEQLQQVRGYYSVPQTLDVDRYRLGDDDQPQDIIIAARELNLDGLQPNQRTWSNDHTVYTHGYGVIAARGNQRGPQGEPVWVARDIPPTGEFEFDIPPRIYFGEQSPLYSIVGRPDGAQPIEVDTPRGGASSTDDTENVTANTYDGTGGVPIGNFFNRALFALKFAEPNIILSDRMNENSRILYDRHPRERVEKVAPWLTLDGDVYPAIVDGRVVWIVDGYTTSNTYPYSESRSLRTATSDTLTQSQAQMALPTDQVNYMRNSVKGVVDAYDGSVTLYEWDEEDPILETWMNVFPDVVEPKSEISEALMEHLRYPVDLFKVQRDVLSRYHVTNAATFYEDGERWVVPEDPSNSAGITQPPYYLSMARPGEESPSFSLTSVYLPQGRENLAAFMSVNSEASGDGFGELQILELPSDTQVGGPNQIAAMFQADRGVTQALLQYEQSQNARILRGNLLTLPVGGGLLYVQPIYIQRSVEQGSYPVLQFIITSFGEDVGIGQTLDESLEVALGLAAADVPVDDEIVDDPAIDEGEATPTPTPTATTPAPTGDMTPEQYLEAAEAAYEAAQAALDAGDLGTYQARIDEMAEALRQAQIGFNNE